MNEQEREVIDGIFRRLEQVADQPRDPEAERLIADKVRRQPYAPYAMAQAVYVQEQALANLQAENERLRAELEQAHRQTQQGGFFSGLFGGSRPPGPSYNAPPPRQASPWGSPAPQPMHPPHPAAQGGMMGAARGPWGGMGQPRGGGFLQSALSTAAGVAGGMMIANALSHAFGGDQEAAAKETADLSGAAEQGGDASYASMTDSLYEKPQDPQDNPEDFSDFSDFGGDEGDWV